MNYLIGVLLIFMSSILTAKGNADEERVILCFGNSLTAGYGLAKEDSWPMLIQEKINAADLNYRVVQSGVSGETSAGGLGRINWVMKEAIDIMILELGPNDGLRGLQLEQTKQNLLAIIQKVKAKNPKVKIIIAGMEVPPNMGPEYTKKFREMFVTLARESNSQLIPFFLKGVAGDKALNLSDGIHPNEKGQKIVTENVWKFLKPML
jgi:acyl-CoA thioesterase-1